MLVNEGYFYHIQDNFFSEINDSFLMSNKENGKYRPHFFAVRDTKNQSILWMIPVSSQYSKYKAIYDSQVAKYGNCTKIVLGKCDGKDAAFLIQNAFPTIDVYFDHIHTTQGQPLTLHKTTGTTIISCLNNNLKLHQHGVKIFFPDIDRIYNLMENKLNP